MHKIFVIVCVAIFLLVGGVLVTRFLSGEDDWICVKGEWAQHGHPAAPMPTSGCGEKMQTKNGVTLTFPDLSLSQKSPLQISGKMDSSWFFEAVAYAQLLDSSEKVIGESQLKAQREWTKPGLVDFTGEISFSTNASDGKLVIQNDNPSGLPANQKEARFPIKLSPSGTVTIKVYFPSSQNDPDYLNSQNVAAVERVIPKTTAVATAALSELFKGPTDAEKDVGYYTGFRPGVFVNKLEIKNGTAYVDINIAGGGDIYSPGTITTGAIFPQLVMTLKQFSDVKYVTIIQNGKPIEMNP